MATLDIEGHKVEVDDSFLKLSPDQQNSTVDEIAKSLGASPPQVAETPPDAAKQEPYTGTLLPLRKDESGNISMAVPTLLSGLADSAASAFSAPYRAMTGELPLTDAAGNVTPQAIGESTNMAMLANPSSIAAGTGKRLAEDAGMTMLKRAADQAEAPRNQLLQSADRLNVKLPTAVASDSASVQQLGKTVSNIPLVGQPIRKAARDAITQLDTAATKAQTDLGAGNPAIAGNVAKEGITDYSKNVLANSVKDRYDKVDTLITQNVTSPLQETTKLATDIAARRSNAALPSSSAVNMMQEALQRPGGLNYQGIKTLRTRVGEMLENPSLIPSDMSQAELKQIYGSLTGDLKTAVERAGGKEALNEFNSANSFAAKVANERETLNKVLGTKSDEAIFDKIVSMAGSTSRADINTLFQVKKAVSPDTWNEVSSAAIARMGRDKEGNLTPDRFITEYGKLSQTGKTALFNPETRQSLDDIAKVSSRFKQLNQYANPSGTGQTVMTGALGGAAFVSPLMAVKVAVPGYITAKLLARPATAKTVADYVKAYELAAKAPGPRSQAFLERRASELAVAAANNNTSAAADIFSKLSAVQKTAADQNSGDQVRQPEGQNQSYSPDEQFYEAYRQGNAT